MHKLLLLLILFFHASVSPAFPMAKRPAKQEKISQGVYGSSDAISKGRVEIAEKLLTDTKRLLPPPKKPLKISEVPGKTILPAKVKGSPIIVDSPEYKKVVTEKKSKKAVAKTEKALVTFTKAVDSEIRQSAKDELKLKADLESARKTIEDKDKKIKHLSGYRNAVFMVVAVIVGLIALYLLSLLARLGISFFR